MTCHDVDESLSEGLRLPLPAQEHVNSCKRCQELVSALNTPVPLDPPSTVTLSQIADGIAARLRPVRPMAPARYFFGAFVVVFVFIVALGVYRMGAFAIKVMTPLQTATILCALGVSAALLAYSLVQQMAPGSRHRFPPKLLPVGIAICLAIAVAAVFQFKHEHNFWARNWSCVRAGTPIAVLAAVPFWLLLRRGAVLSPRMTGAATGLFAGLAGTSVLEIHCPNLDAWHILISHLGVAIVCALAGFAIGLTAEIIARRSIHRSDQERRSPSNPV
jgi:hypothetical protein